ncbi:MAG: hypothetical protein LUH40_05515 [Clostridiales bacterium]|nr:hypothetical protein [Clostridiales bacterium]
MHKIKFLTKVSAFILIFCIILSISSFGVFAEYLEEYDISGTGLIWDTPETIASFPDATPDVSIQATLPTSVDNTSKFPTPGNQGTSASCVAWAVGYALM